MPTPRGRKVDAVRHIGNSLAGRTTESVIVVYIRPGSLSKDFLWWTQKNAKNIRVKPLDEIGHTYEVVGQGQFLDALVQRKCVQDWHNCLSVKPPHGGWGQGSKPARRILSWREEQHKVAAKEMMRQDKPVAENKAAGEGWMRYGVYRNEELLFSALTKQECRDWVEENEATHCEIRGVDEQQQYNSPQDISLTYAVISRKGQLLFVGPYWSATKEAEGKECILTVLTDEVLTALAKNAKR
jgi:hypothetical protein